MSGRKPNYGELSFPGGPPGGGSARRAGISSSATLHRMPWPPGAGAEVKLSGARVAFTALILPSNRVAFTGEGKLRKATGYEQET
jgi:hypothetical protein